MEGYEDPTIAQLKYWEIKKNFNCESLIALAVREGYASDEKSAYYALDGLLQWLCCHGVRGHCDALYVMMEGHVEKMYQALIIDTNAYLNFCEEFLGFYVHHQLVGGDIEARVNLVDGVNNTLTVLQGAFGSDLAPSLREWIEQDEKGTLHVSALSCAFSRSDDPFKKSFDFHNRRNQWKQTPFFATVD